MNADPTITASIVLYKHSFSELRQILKVFDSISACHDIYLIDNSPEALELSLTEFPKACYMHQGNNLGYGKGHNVAIEKALQNSKYHLVINPDIEVTPEAILKMAAYMDAHPNIGLLMPKVLYPDGSIQHLCKLFPTPFDLIFRRFIPKFVKQFIPNYLNRYELKNRDYNQQMEVPNLSGCFMFLRCEALKTVGLFDSRFFMYLEDTDLSRRINQEYQTIYYPEVSIVHHYQKGSYKNIKLLFYHIRSAIQYFNKWGWFFDPTRNTINKITSKG